MSEFTNAFVMLDDRLIIFPGAGMRIKFFIINPLAINDLLTNSWCFLLASRRGLGLKNS